MKTDASQTYRGAREKKYIEIVLVIMNSFLLVSGDGI